MFAVKQKVNQNSLFLLHKLNYQRIAVLVNMVYVSSILQNQSQCQLSVERLRLEHVK